MQVSATEAKDRFGEIMAAASDEVVTITKYGRPDKVVISFKRLQELEAIEDRYWLELSRQGEESGSMGVEETKAYIESVLDAQS